MPISGGIALIQMKGRQGHRLSGAQANQAARQPVCQFALISAKEDELMGHAISRARQTKTLDFCRV